MNEPNPEVVYEMCLAIKAWAAAIVRQAQAGLEEATDPGILKRLGRILASANVILRLLEGQGAKTRPAPSGKGVYVTDQREAAETFKKK